MTKAFYFIWYDLLMCKKYC